MLANKIKKLIDDNADEFGFIKDFTSIIEFLKNKNVDDETIVQIINEIVLYNKKIYSDLSGELKVCEELLSREPTTPIENKKTKVTIATSAKNTKKEIPSLEFILSIINSNPLEKLEDALSVNNINETITNYAIIHFIKLKRDFNKQLETEQDLEYKEIIQYEISKIESIIEKLIEYRDDIEIQSDSPEEINLVFIDEDIIYDFDKIPTELYKDFLLLLESIKNGNPKNVKKFATPVSNSAITEVRKNNNIRILFDKINASTYCVYCAFIKDEVNKQYMERLEHRAGKYFTQKQFLIDKLIEGDPEFIEQQQEIERKLFEKLSPQKTKKKGVLPC